MGARIYQRPGHTVPSLPEPTPEGLSGKMDTEGRSQDLKQLVLTHLAHLLAACFGSGCQHSWVGDSGPNAGWGREEILGILEGSAKSG